MDIVSRRRLAVLIGLLLTLGAWLAPVPARASVNASYDQAMTQCQAYLSDGFLAVKNSPANLDDHYQSRISGEHCAAGPDNHNSCGDYFVCVHYAWDGSDDYSIGSFHFSGDVPPDNPCEGMESANIYLEGKILAGSSTCVRGPVQDNGAQAMCGVNLSPISPPTWNPYGGGHWQTYASFSPTGQVCGEGSGDSAGLIEGADGSPADAPPIPDPLPATDDPPKICGGVSCYDPATDTACGMVDGVQSCVSGASGRSPSGGCSTSGGTTICSGSPNAPAPPPGDVPNPPGQTGGSDTGLQADPATGQSIPTGTTIYGPPGGTVSSGQGPGDSGPSQSGGGTGGDDGSGGDPAPSSSTGGDNGSYSGGTDCNNPPACSGDAVACGAARTQWATVCQVHKDLTGTGDAKTQYESLKGKYTQSDVWVDGGTGTGNTVGDQANAGNYDASGFGFGTQCPMENLTIPLWSGQSIDLPLEKGCIIGPWIRGIVLAMALYAAARITAGSKG